MLFTRLGTEIFCRLLHCSKAWLPIFVKPTGSSIESGSIYALANKTNPFTFKAVEAAGTSFPTGTIFSWTITDGSGHTVTKLGQEVTVSPDGDGLSAGLYSPGSNWTVSCTASHPGAEDDRVAAPGSFYVYKITIPAITGMSMDKPASATGASSPYCIKNMSDTFGFTVQWTSGAILHADTVLTWSVSTDGGTTWTTVSGETSSTANIAPNEFGTIGFGSASATSCQVKCTASHPALPDTENKSWSISFGLYRCFPAFSIGISTTTLPSRLDSSGNTIYTVRQSNIDGGTDGLTLTATLTDAAVAAGESFLSGTTFTWKVESTTLSGTGLDAQSVSPSLCSMGISTIGAAATSPAATEYTVTCTAKYGVLESGEVTETCRISPPIKLDSSYGRFRTGYGITLQATSYSGDRGTYLHLNISGTAADDATTNATFYNNRSSVIPAAANATYNWYLGKSNNPNKTPIINGSKTLLGSIAYTDDANGYYNITVSNLKSQISAYNIVFLQVAPGTSGDALNYETSDLTAVVAFNDEIRYTN